MSFPDRFLSDNEIVVSAFRPHWKMLLKPVIIFDLVLAAGIVVAVVTSVAAWIPIVAAAAIGLLVTAKPLLEWFFTSYVITSERLIVRSGILSRSGKEIPLEVINDVAFSQTVGERVFRSGDLLVESAGELGQSRYSDIPHPEEVQSLIYELREERITMLNSGRSAAAELATLAQLHRDGTLTDDEFADKKRKLLDEI